MFEWWGDGILHCTPELVSNLLRKSKFSIGTDMHLLTLKLSWKLACELHSKLFCIKKTTCDGKKVDMLILIHISAHLNLEMWLQLLFSVINIFHIYPQYNIKQTFFYRWEQSEKMSEAGSITHSMNPPMVKRMSDLSLPKKVLDKTYPSSPQNFWLSRTWKLYFD